MLAILEDKPGFLQKELLRLGDVPVTPATLAQGLLLLVLVWVVSNLTRRVLRDRVLKATALDSGAREAIARISIEPAATDEAKRLAAMAAAARKQGDGKKVAAATKELRALQAELERQYAVLIVNAPGEQSATARRPRTSSRRRSSVRSPRQARSATRPRSS